MERDDTDRHDLRRFVEAQSAVYAQARDELAASRKQSHWMWFVFPQLRGLGHSAMARHYGIASREEAAAYLAHPVLGPRLRECVQLMLAVQGRTAHEIFGSPDDLKLRSSATLFAAVSPAGSVFHRIVDAYFDGQADAVTLRLMQDAG